MPICSRPLIEPAVCTLLRSVAAEAIFMIGVLSGRSAEPKSLSSAVSDRKRIDQANQKKPPELDRSRAQAWTDQRPRSGFPERFDRYAAAGFARPARGARCSSDLRSAPAGIRCLKTW